MYLYCWLGESCISPALIMAASNDKSYNVLPPIPSKVQVRTYLVNHFMLVIVLLTSILTNLLGCLLCIYARSIVYKLFFQGPFKKPEEVIRQKFRPLQPTLRVATAYDSVETAR